MSISVAAAQRTAVEVAFETERMKNLNMYKQCSVHVELIRLHVNISSGMPFHDFFT